MDEIVRLLKDLDSRLATLEQVLTKPNLTDLLTKSHYSCRETAALTKLYGTKCAATFTVRLACADGRVPEAQKFPDGIWRIPREAVLQILSIGLPPERRDRA